VAAHEVQRRKFRFLQNTDIVSFSFSMVDNQSFDA
jgi:hypothetical protein